MAELDAIRELARECKREALTEASAAGGALSTTSTRSTSRDSRLLILIIHPCPQAASRHVSTVKAAHAREPDHCSVSALCPSLQDLECARIGGGSAGFGSHENLHMVLAAPG
jgi:hypothetical protein